MLKHNILKPMTQRILKESLWICAERLTTFYKLSLFVILWWKQNPIVYHYMEACILWKMNCKQLKSLLLITFYKEFGSLQDSVIQGSCILQQAYRAYIIDLSNLTLLSSLEQLPLTILLSVILLLLLPS